MPAGAALPAAGCGSHENGFCHGRTSRKLRYHVVPLAANVWYLWVPSQGMMMVTKRPLKPVAAEAEPNPVQGRILEAAFSAFMEYGFAETSTLEIATRAKVSKRELYALFGSKQDMLIACIRARTKRFQMTTELPEPRDREMLVHVLTAFGKQLLRETTDPAVIAAFRLAIAEALRTPEVARELNASGIQANRAALREIMARACAAGLLSGKPAEIAEQFAGL